jgi:hypothetical protein
MKRLVAALVAGVVSLIGAASAAAAAPPGVAEKRVAQARDAVAAYWTPERMRSAIPADIKRGPGAGVRRAAVAAPSALEFPSSYTQFPASTHGKVFFTSGAQNFVCSGTALTSQNRSVVWTAGHCVNQGPGTFHTNWAFVPAYRDGTRPLGTWTARTLMTTSQWRDTGNIAFDVGAAVVSTNPSGQALTDVTGGGRGIEFNYARAQTYQSWGYPAAPPFNGQRLWTCTSGYLGPDPFTSPQTMSITCDMTGGASGGGWVVGSSVFSVNSYGYSDQPGVMYGPYQGPEAQSLFASAQVQ